MKTTDIKLEFSAQVLMNIIGTAIANTLKSEKLVDDEFKRLAIVERNTISAIEFLLKNDMKELKSFIKDTEEHIGTDGFALREIGIVEQKAKENITVSLETVEKMFVQTLTSVFGYLVHETSEDEAYELMTDTQYPKVLAEKIIETYRVDNFKKLNDLIKLKMEERANV